jgi:HEAT repeat protein
MYKIGRPVVPKLFWGVWMMAILSGGCASTTKRIDEAIDRLAWAEHESDIWTSSVETLIDLDRTAARTLTSALGQGWYRAEQFREFQREVDNIRYGAARVLGTLRYKAAVAALDDYLPNTQPDYVRKEMAWALGEIGTVVEGLTAQADAIAKQLKDEDPFVALEMAIALCKMDDERGDSLLLAALGSDDSGIWGRVERGLLEADYHGVAPLLKAVAAGGSSASRGSAVLERLTDQLVEDLPEDDKDVRWKTARVLGDIPEKMQGKVREPLADLLDDSYSLVRLWAATSLSKMGDPRGRDYLFEALGSEDNVSRIKAIGALIEAGVSVEEELLHALDGANVLVRAGAIYVLGEGRMERAVLPLVKALDDTSAAIRWNAAVALGKIGRGEAAKALRPLLADRDSTVVYYANWALARLER